MMMAGVAIWNKASLTHCHCFLYPLYHYLSDIIVWYVEVVICRASQFYAYNSFCGSFAYYREKLEYYWQDTKINQHSHSL